MATKISFGVGERLLNMFTDEYGYVQGVLATGSIMVKYDHADEAVIYGPEEFDRFRVVGRQPKEHRVVAAPAAPPLPIMPLPHDSAERKTYPIMTAFIDYFPSAVAALAHHSYVSNEKHNPGQPVHWSRDKSGDHLDAAARHLLERDLHGLAWRAMAALQMQLEAEGHPVAPAAR